MGKEVTHDMILKVAEELMGSCQDSFENVFSEMYPDYSEDDISPEVWGTFDSCVFECTCGWWCAASERNWAEERGEDICDDCYEIYLEEVGDED